VFPATSYDMYVIVFTWFISYQYAVTVEQHLAETCSCLTVNWHLGESELLR